MPNRPVNVMVGKQLPQDEVLAHLIVVLFIIYCGKGRHSEQKYKGFPVLGIPIFGDQQSNVEKLVGKGWALKLPYCESLLRPVLMF